MLSQNFLWALGLMAMAGVLLLAELLIPSAGLLGIGAAMAAIAALVLAYSESTGAGVTMTGILVMGAPILMMTAMRIWPHTPIGRRMLNLPPLSEKAGGGDAFQSGQSAGLWTLENPYRELLGKVGIARTDMLPSGQIEIEGRKFDAVALGMAVDRGQFVEVTSVDAGKIRVKQTTRRPVEHLGATVSVGQSNDGRNGRGGEDSDKHLEQRLANRPLEDFDIEDLSDPLK